jgi:hypothetical protein
MKMIIFWDVVLCSLAEVYSRFRGACCLHHQGDESFKTKVVCFGREITGTMATTPKNCPGFESR